MLDIAARLALPVVLVVGVRLGCLNHALVRRARDPRARPARSPAGSRRRVDPAMAHADANVAALRRAASPRRSLADLALAAPARWPADALARLGAALTPFAARHGARPPGVPRRAKISRFVAAKPRSFEAMSVTLEPPARPMPHSRRRAAATTSRSRPPAALDASYGALAAGSLAMALGFVAGGVWPVLPYSVARARRAGRGVRVDRAARERPGAADARRRPAIVEQRARGTRDARASSRGTGCASRSTRKRLTHEPRLVLKSGRDAMRFGDARPGRRAPRARRAIRGLLAAR